MRDLEIQLKRSSMLDLLDNCLASFFFNEELAQKVIDLYRDQKAIDNKMIIARNEVNGKLDFKVTDWCYDNSENLTKDFELKHANVALNYDVNNVYGPSIAVKVAFLNNKDELVLTEYVSVQIFDLNDNY